MCNTVIQTGPSVNDKLKFSCKCKTFVSFEHIWGALMAPSVWIPLDKLLPWSSGKNLTRKDKKLAIDFFPCCTSSRFLVLSYVQFSEREVAVQAENQNAKQRNTHALYLNINWLLGPSHLSFGQLCPWYYQSNIVNS